MLGAFYQKSSQAFFDLLFPPSCVHCKAANSWLCQDCLADIPLISGSICERCGTPSPTEPSSFCEQCHNHPLKTIDSIRVAAYFEDNPLRLAIHHLKYRNNKAISSVLSTILFDTYRHSMLIADVVVPVPLHRARLRQRGYNQSELLAGKFARLAGLPLNTNTLQRTRNTASQMKLGAQERHKNVADAFTCYDRLLANRHVLLVDDVCTTGSTLDACAAALKNDGSASVVGLALAKAR